MKENIMKKFEFVAYYPNQKKTGKQRKLAGTCHVYLIEKKIDLRGISVIKAKKGYIFHMPTYKTIDLETNQEVRYAVFSFMEKSEHDELIEFLKTEGTKAIEESIKTPS